MPQHLKSNPEKKDFSQISRWTWLLLLLTAIALIVFGWAAGKWYTERLIAESRLAVSSQLAPYGTTLSNAVSKRFALLNGLTAFVYGTLDSGHLETHFEPFVEDLYESANGVRNLGIYPDGIGKYIYPFEGNESAIGHDLIHDDRPLVRADVERALETRRVTMSGPYTLLQGGFSLVGRQAIYVDDTFWGLTTVVLDMPTVLRETGLEAGQSGLDIAIFDTRGNLFYGRKEVLDERPVFLTVSMPEGSWRIAAIPWGGWNQAIENSLRLFYLTTFVMAALIMALVILVATQQDMLRNRVAEKTWALSRELAARIKTEGELVRERNRLNRVMETSPAGILMAAPDGRLEYANERAEIVLGLSRSSITQRTYNAPDWQVTGIEGEPFTDKDYPIRRAIDSRTSLFGVRHAIVKPNGERTILSVNAGPIIDDEGNLEGVVAMIHDVTDDHVAKEKLRESEERFRTVFEESNILMALVDESGQILTANFAALYAFGYNAAELHGLSINQLIHPEDLASSEQMYDELLAGKFSRTPPVEKRFIRKDGRILWGRHTATVIRDANGSIQFVVGMVEDITQQKLEEAAHQESEMRFQTLFEESPLGIIVIHEGLFDYVNAAFLRMFGLNSAKEVEGCSIAEFAEGDDRQKLIEQIRRWNEDQSVPPRFEMVGRRRDGSLIDVSVEISTIQLGDIQANLGFITDITERKSTERQLERYRTLSENSNDMMYFIRQSDARILEANQAALRLYGYSREELLEMSLYDLRTPEEALFIQDQMEQASKGGITFETIHHNKNGVAIPVEVTSQGIIIQGERVILSVARDISDRKQAQLALQSQMQETLARASELEALSRLSIALRKADTREELIEAAVTQVMRSLGAQSVSLAVLKGNTLTFQGFAEQSLGYELVDLSVDQKVLWSTLRGAGPTLLGASSVEMASLAKIVGKGRKAIECVILSPLVSGEEPIGLLLLGYDAEQELLSNQKQLITAMSEIIASQLQRKMIAETMEKLVAERTRELETIYNVTFSASDLEDLRFSLDKALTLLLDAVHAEMGAVLIYDELHDRFELMAHRNLPADFHAHLESLSGDGSAEGWVLNNSRALVIPDISSNAYGKDIFFPGMGRPSLTILPMKVGDRVVGVLNVSHSDGQQPNLDDMTLLSFVADHLGLVVENSRLLHQAGQAAVMEERSRLARELHDSVTQSLYSATLFADGGRRLVEQGKVEPLHNLLIQLGKVTQQALKDMRLLVYELRSPGLLENGLVSAIQQRLDAVEARAGVHVVFEADEKIGRLPEASEQEIYRIVIEALNNSLKHSGADQVNISLKISEEQFVVCIADNGAGFQLNAAEMNGGMGLTSMRERAARLNGRLEIDSNAGDGSKISAFIPLEKG